MTDVDVFGAPLGRLMGRIINGDLPPFILPIFYGATLTAFKKKSGGLRPIACGVAHGAEAIVHATRFLLNTASSLGDQGDCSAGIKLDFSNAFNSIRRDWLLDKIECSSLTSDR